MATARAGVIGIYKTITSNDGLSTAITKAHPHSFEFFSAANTAIKPKDGKSSEALSCEIVDVSATIGFGHQDSPIQNLMLGQRAFVALVGLSIVTRGTV